MTISLKRRMSTLAAASLLAASVDGAVLAQAVTVQLNGNTLNLSPAPTERAGRVFVPLRGVFENLGASVVYANGTINAQGRGHSVSLHIGSTAATVDGQGVNVDVAPFIIGASTYVPLRFVSQALGATVNWDNGNRIVSIAANGANVANNPPPQNVTPANNANSNIGLTNRIPAPGSTVTGRRPTIEAEFTNTTADQNSVHVTVDGNDVSSDSTRTERGFAYAPRNPLLRGNHTVRVTGRDVAGANFSRQWTFTVEGSATGANSVSNLTPADGDTVGTSFTVAGHTRPNARVVVQLGTTSQQVGSIGQLIGAVLGGNAGANGAAQTFQRTITADGNGAFSLPVSVSAASGSNVLLVVQSTDPQTGEAAQAQSRLTVR